MPRGGGGFRGGGFGGGGFRGGGFRGGGRSFRVGRVRSSGRPFGRTGSRRTVSRAPRSSGYRRHHRYGGHYWGPYYRPWWRRWWYWNWWWGYPYRPWYRAPVYWGGGVVLAIVVLLIILPAFIFIPFPFSNASTEGTVTYRDTQTLYYNEYWYESEHVGAGSSINYRVEAQSQVTFAIWDLPFEALPTTTLNGSYSEEDMVVQGNHDYQYIGYFLRPGSELSYNFTVTGGAIEFFIADANDLNRWNNWETIIPEVQYIGSDGDIGTFDVDYAQDWYLVWYNSGSNPVSIDFTVNYLAVGAPDFSATDVHIENVVDPVSGTFTTPNEGAWFFFIYLDPFVNPEEAVDITFDVSYETGITSSQRWADFSPILMFIGLIVVIVLIIAIIQRSTGKKTPEVSAAASTASTETSSTTTAPATPTRTTEGQCHRCNFRYNPGDVYCKNCGAKLYGRDYGVAKISTPASAKNCQSCGADLKPGSRYCKNCGAKVEKPAASVEFAPKERKTFFCQLDNEKHPATDSGYECEQCSRMICASCYTNMSQTGITACPYCKGNLVKVQ
ncbi:MAG: zinc ribbon domain-containing protein [Candidatus Heimdallarchaeota archaeon]